jgi:hypothetical protein
MFSLVTGLELLSKVGPVVAALPQFKALWDQGVATLHPKDQPTAKEAYHDLIAENAEGHARLQAKLAAASKQ